MQIIEKSKKTAGGNSRPKTKGYSVMRFTDDEVSGSGEKVIEKIKEKLNVS